VSSNSLRTTWRQTRFATLLPHHSPVVHFVFPQEKPYIPVFCDVSLKALSEFMLDRWKMKVPDVMISIVTGVFHNKNWPEDYAIAFQNGLTKVFPSTTLNFPF
jgi:hypothetical protein